MLQAAELVKMIEKGLLKWYDFHPGRRVLYIGTAEEVLAELLSECGLEVICAACGQTCELAWQAEYTEKFDYIVSIESLEHLLDPRSTLRAWRKLLQPDGRLLLGMNNRLGVRYFCGDRDFYTDRNFDGIENYRQAYASKSDLFHGRCYSRAELKDMLQDTGWSSCQFFSVLTDLHHPSLIYAEDYLPNEDLSIRLFPTYHSPDTVFLEEEGLYSSLIANGLFHQMANAYLIECSCNGVLSDVLHVTSSMERGQEDALLTVIHRTGVVEKRAAFPEGQSRLKELLENGQDLTAHGIRVVGAKLENGVYVMPYMETEVGQVHLKRMLQTDPEKFLQELDHFRDLILQSSDIVKPDVGDGQGATLRWGYVDMVPLNSFYQDGTFVFYDQEFRMENCPANLILTRMVMSLYGGSRELERIIPMRTLLDRYGLTACLERWNKIEREFLTALRKERELRIYHEHSRRSAEALNVNRQRVNFSEADYQRLFVDIFRHADTRKLILFGSGAYAKKFLALYGRDYPVDAIIDNNAKKWGQNLEGIPIQSPELLRQMQEGEYKVLICMKNYLSVMRQLDTMGIGEYGV